LFIIPMIAAGVGAGVIFLGNRFHRIGLIMLVAGHTLCGAYVIRHMTQPRIDVWYFQQASTEALVHGQNPYDVRYRNIYEPERDFYGPGAVVDGYMTISYPYPPLTLLVTAPGRLLGDVRWAHLAAMELAVALIVLAAPSRTATWAAAMLLLSPRSLMIIYCAWTESLVVLALATVVYCAMRAPKHLWMALGIFLAMKQYTVLVLPLALLLLQRSAIKSVATKAFSLAMLIALPFVLWNPMSFVRSVVLMQFNQPFRIESLSFAAMFAVVTGIQIPSLIGFVFAGGALVWCLQKASRSLAGFAGSTALVLLLFFAFNKQAFCNYYFGVIGACCGAMAVSAPHRARALREESSLPLRIAA
jgi:hypothetical protein